MKTLKIPQETHEQLTRLQSIIYAKTGIKMPFYEIIGNGNNLLEEAIKNEHK